VILQSGGGESKPQESNTSALESTPQNSEAKEFQVLVKDAGISKFQHGSDHCPVWVDFVESLPTLPEHPFCALSSKSIQQARVRITLSMKTQVKE
jgi:hypothetical protein